MPTNILRHTSRTTVVRDAGERALHPAATGRTVEIRAGRVSVRARLFATPTADRIWHALPIFSTAQLWGQGEVFFETAVESGRERGAKTIVTAGEIIFAPDRDVIGIAFARTPTSKSGELRLWSPSNVWAEALDDVSVFHSVRPGEKVEVRRLEVGSATRST